MAGTHLLFMACSGRKLEQTAPALQLYTGVMYQTYRAHVDARHKPTVAIVSAEHGLVGELDLVAPYERAMTRERFEQVLAGITDQVDAATWWPSRVDSIFMAGGLRYRQVMAAAVDHLEMTGRLAADAQRGMTRGGIGLQRQQLANYLKGLRRDGRASRSCSPGLSVELGDPHGSPPASASKALSSHKETP